MIDFHTLQIWQKSHSIALNIYQISADFSKEEIFGLRSQLRRSAVSIPSNIAEGCGRNSDGDLARFLTIAMGSASELEYQILLSRDLKYISIEEFQSLNTEIIEVRIMLNSFMDKVNKRNRGKKLMLFGISVTLLFLSYYLLSSTP